MAARTSTTLTGAVQALVAKQNQIVRTGVVTELRVDGSVYCRVEGLIVLVQPATDQPMQAGMVVHLVKSTGGKYTLLGGP